MLQQTSAALVLYKKIELKKTNNLSVPETKKFN